MTPRDLARLMWERHCRVASWFTPRRLACTWLAIAFAFVGLGALAVLNGEADKARALTVVAVAFAAMGVLNWTGAIHP